MAFRRLKKYSSKYEWKWTVKKQCLCRDSNPPLNTPRRPRRPLQHRATASVKHPSHPQPAEPTTAASSRNRAAASPPVTFATAAAKNRRNVLLLARLPLRATIKTRSESRPFFEAGQIRALQRSAARRAGRDVAAARHLFRVRSGVSSIPSVI